MSDQATLKLKTYYVDRPSPTAPAIIRLRDKNRPRDLLVMPGIRDCSLDLPVCIVCDGMDAQTLCWALEYAAAHTCGGDACVPTFTKHTPLDMRGFWENSRPAQPAAPEDDDAGDADGSPSVAYEDGRQCGYKAGKRDGAAEGHNAGYDAGYKTGHRDGLAAGGDAAHEIGYKLGYDAGVRSTRGMD